MFQKFAHPRRERFHIRGRDIQGGIAAYLRQRCTVRSNNGAPQDMASRTGRPNPSYSERYRKARQPLRRAATASSGRKPVRWICRVSAHSRTIPPQFQPFCPTSRRCASGYFSTRRRNARITQVSPFRGSTVARLTKNGVWRGCQEHADGSVCPPSAA